MRVSEVDIDCVNKGYVESTIRVLLDNYGKYPPFWSVVYKVLEHKHSDENVQARRKYANECCKAIEYLKRSGIIVCSKDQRFVRISESFVQDKLQEDGSYKL